MSSPRKRRVAAQVTSYAEQDEDDSMFFASDSEEGGSYAVEDEEEKSVYVIEEILAVQSLSASAWETICSSMTTRYVLRGSLREVAPCGEEREAPGSQRYLVKWKQRDGSPLSHLHLSWQTSAELKAHEGQPFGTKLRRFHRRRRELETEAEEYDEGVYVDPRFTVATAFLDVSVIEETDADAEETDGAGLDVDGEDAEEEEEDDEPLEFITKWSTLGAECWTWESAADLDRHCAGGAARRKELEEVSGCLIYLFHFDRMTKITEYFTYLIELLNDYYLQVLRQRQQKSPKLSKLKYRPKAKQLAALPSLSEAVFGEGRRLRSYQVEGVDWLTRNWQRRKSAILGDEMGLGKTVQICTLISRLCTAPSFALNAKSIIVVPLSTIAHWEREFAAWTDLNAVTYYGNSDARENIRSIELKPLRWDVLITTYETVSADVEFLRKTKWGFLIVDEAHRLKAEHSRLAECLNTLRTGYRVLMTGTPIQNDVAELFSLLAFIDDQKFCDRAAFLEKFGTLSTGAQVKALQKQVLPYMLRRVKADVLGELPAREETVVEVEMSQSQKVLYRAVFEANVEQLSRVAGRRGNQPVPSLMNVMMQLRKVCNHPWLVDGVEETAVRDDAGDQIAINAKLIAASGKLVLLDKLLTRLRSEGHRVLIFSQMVRMLDVLEDFLAARSMEFTRIDGNITGRKRQQAIDRFTDNDSCFAFLLSTKAGGVGINLTAADTVVIFDSDWNPQNDLQAMARCHRIGQTKVVRVFRLVCAGSYEKHMVHISMSKLGLSSSVLGNINAGADGAASSTALTKEEMERLLKQGAMGIFQETEGEGVEASRRFANDSIDNILARSTTVQVNAGDVAGQPAAAGAGGSIFSKATFTTSEGEAVSMDDPDFWSKVVPEVEKEVAAPLQPRKRKSANAAALRMAEQSGSGAGSMDADGHGGDDDFMQLDDYVNKTERDKLTSALTSRGLRSAALVLEGGSLSNLISWRGRRTDIWSVVKHMLGVWSWYSSASNSSSSSSASVSSAPPPPSSAALAWTTFESNGAHAKLCDYVNKAHVADDAAEALSGKVEPAFVDAPYVKRCVTKGKAYLDLLEMLMLLTNTCETAGVDKSVIAPADGVRSSGSSSSSSKIAQSPAPTSSSRSTTPAAGAAPGAGAVDAAAMELEEEAQLPPPSGPIEILAAALPPRINKSPAKWWNASYDAALVIGFLRWGYNAKGMEYLYADKSLPFTSVKKDLRPPYTKLSARFRCIGAEIKNPRAPLPGPKAKLAKMKAVRAPKKAKAVAPPKSLITSVWGVAERDRARFVLQRFGIAPALSSSTLQIGRADAQWRSSAASSESASSSNANVPKCFFVFSDSMYPSVGSQLGFAVEGWRPMHAMTARTWGAMLTAAKIKRKTPAMLKSWCEKTRNEARGVIAANDAAKLVRAASKKIGEQASSLLKLGVPATQKGGEKEMSIVNASRIIASATTMARLHSALCRAKVSASSFLPCLHYLTLPQRNHLPCFLTLYLASLRVTLLTLQDP